MKNLFVSALFSLLFMQAVHTMDISPDQNIKIRTEEGTQIEVPYKLVRHSKTLRNMIEDIPDLSQPIPIHNVTKTEWDQVILLLSLLDENKQAELRQALERLSIEQLAELITAINYLDIKPLLAATTDVIADKIKQSPQLVCNTTTLAEVLNRIKDPAKRQEKQQHCDTALQITIDSDVEKIIAQKIAPPKVQEQKIDATTKDWEIKEDLREKDWQTSNPVAPTIQDDIVIIKRNGDIVHQIPSMKLGIDFTKIDEETKKITPPVHPTMEHLLKPRIFVHPNGKYLLVIKNIKPRSHWGAVLTAYNIAVWDIQNKPQKIYETIPIRTGITYHESYYTDYYNVKILTSNEVDFIIKLAPFEYEPNTTIVRIYLTIRPAEATTIIEALQTSKTPKDQESELIKALQTLTQKLKALHNAIKNK